MIAVLDIIFLLSFSLTAFPTDSQLSSRVLVACPDRFLVFCQSCLVCVSCCFFLAVIALCLPYPLLFDFGAFPLLRIDTDNGSEFINYELLNFCKDEKITFTRSRSYRKNDQAHVEQKNGSVVRRLVGYDRFEGHQAWQALSELYSVLRLYVNYFQPSLKLLSKKRDGARVTKKYDRAKTPYQRILAASLNGIEKPALTKYYQGLDPVERLESMETLQDKLWKYGFVALPGNVPITSQSLMPKTDDAIEDNQSRRQKEQTLLPIETSSCDRFYRRSKKTKRPRAPRTWRTRKDPFENVWGEIRRKLELNPMMTATQMLSDLVLKSPQDFNKNQCRTLQRRIRTWRKEQQDHEANMRHLLLPDATEPRAPDVIFPSKKEEEVVRF